MSTIRNHSALFALLTLLAYFFIAQTSIQTKHTHFYPNGVVITHSHPIHSEEDEPINQHHHSKSEICFFNNLQFQSYQISEPLGIQLISVEIQTEYFIADDEFFSSEQHLKPVPRGPPLG